MRQRWSPPTRRTLICACWSAGITLATVSYLALLYPTLPRGLPVRYLNGEPVFFQTKTITIVLLPAMVQAALLLTFGALCLLLLWRARPGHTPADEADRVRMSLAVEGIALLGAVWITVQAIGAARLTALWQLGGRPGFGQVYNVTLLVAVAISAFVVWNTMKTVRQQHPVSAESNPDLWRFTHLYVNAEDPALFVPTRRGVGWTLNFGRPLAIVLIATILSLGVGGPFLLARSVLWDGAFVMFQVPPPPHR